MEEVLNNDLAEAFQKLVEAIVEVFQELMDHISKLVKSILSDFQELNDKNIEFNLKIDSRRQFGAQNTISRGCMPGYSKTRAFNTRYYFRR